MQNREPQDRSQDHVAQCNIKAITTIKFPLVFLPSLFTFSSLSCLVFTTWSLKLHSRTRGPTCTKGPRAPKGTRGLCRMLWYDPNISKFVLNAGQFTIFTAHDSYKFVEAFVFGLKVSFFVAFCNKKRNTQRDTQRRQLISDLDATYADAASCWWMMLAFHCELASASTTEQNVLVSLPPCGHFQVEDWPWPAPAAAPKAAEM